jgi:hypothetical protein
MKEPQKADSPGTEVHHPKPLQRHPATSMGGFHMASTNCFIWKYQTGKQRDK